MEKKNHTFKGICVGYVEATKTRWTKIPEWELSWNKLIPAATHFVPWGIHQIWECAMYWAKGNDPTMGKNN